MLQQHRVGMLFGLFVRTIGAARFACAIAPVAALVAVASIPLPRSVAPVDASAASPGFLQRIPIAQRASASSSERFVLASVAASAHASHASRLPAAGPASRIGDRWLQWRDEHRASQHDADRVPRHVGDRLLHPRTGLLPEQWATPSIVDAFARFGGAAKNVAASGVSARAPPDAPAPGAANEASASAYALVEEPPGTPVPDASAPSHAALPEPDRPVAETRDARAALAATDRVSGQRDSFSPLKLTAEQRNISRFVAQRYRVKLDDVQRFVAHAFRAAGEFRLDPYLVLAVMSIESSFNPNARSSAGAQGLMQVLTRVHLDKFAPFGGARAALDPMANISVGSRILKEYLVREGSVEGALKSYVGAALLSHDYGYGSKVLGERARIAAAAQGRALPAPTRAWVPTSKLAMADAKPPIVRARVRSSEPKTLEAKRAEPADAAPATDVRPVTAANVVAPLVPERTRERSRVAERAGADEAHRAVPRTTDSTRAGAPTDASASALRDSRAL